MGTIHLQCIGYRDKCVSQIPHQSIGATEFFFKDKTLQTKLKYEKITLRCVIFFANSLQNISVYFTSVIMFPI